jgi:hypothetical protein
MSRIIPELTGGGASLPIDASDISVAGPLVNAPSAPTDLETVLSEFDSAFSSLGALTFKGTWNATTNAPSLSSGVGTSGDYYVVGVGGSTSLDGITDWVAGDHLVFDGAQTMWIKIDNTDVVSSVFGRTGAVSAASGDYDADEITYDNTSSGLTAVDVQAAIDEVEGRVDSLEIAPPTHSHTETEVTITGDHPVLEDPTTVAELVDYLDLTTRPQVDSGNIPATIYIDSVSGSDITGDGTVGTPFETLSRAYQLHAFNPSVARTIQLAVAGTYPVTGRGIHALNRLTISGPAPTIANRTVTVDGASSRSAGLILNDSIGGMTVDAFRGSIVEFHGGALEGSFGVIYQNTAGQFFVSQDTVGTFVTSGVTSIDIRTNGATITLPDGPFTFESASALVIEDVDFVQTNRELRFNDTDQVTCRRCRFFVQSIAAGRGGTGNFQTCYMANDGTTSTDSGMVYARTQGILALQRGSVIDGVNAAAAAAHVLAASFGFIDTWGETVFRDLGDNGILCRSSYIAVRSDSITTDSEWRFLDCTNGIRVNSDDEGAGGALHLPDCFGNITSTTNGYLVSATRGAFVRIGDISSSSVTTAVSGGTGTNDVSADNEVSFVAQDEDGTYIAGGTPVASGFLSRDGLTTGSLLQAQDFGSNGITADVLAESTASNGVLINGNRHYADSATDPSSPTPLEGDRYYNTTLEMEMRYDGLRSKWLSVNEAWLHFGRAGNTADGAFFDGAGGIQFTSDRGFPASFNGTVVAISFTRDDTDSATIEITRGGTLITGATYTSTSLYNAPVDIDADFASGAALGVRNQSTGSTVTNLMGWVRIKWRI